ncbi:glycoside hydrolase family 88 protein [Alteromonadaceae bacterium BrNp21-10]|nr:glycoside hydrolase family 88 protein [Alteromonadaceae bacterium BrNp21-10]
MKQRIKLTTISALIIGSGLVLSGCGEEHNNVPATGTVATNSNIADLEVHNSSDFPREKQPVYLSYYNLGLDPAGVDIKVLQAGKSIDSQAVDSDFDGQVDGLLFLSDFAAGATQRFEVVAGDGVTVGKKLTQAEISHKIGGEWVAHSKLPDTSFKEYIGGTFQNVDTVTPPPQYTDHSNWIRYEGPGIESDKVGYRIYLDWRNGFDIFGKLTAEPALQQAGLNDYESYHEKQDWGMDILKVGSSLGAGGFGLWNEGELELVNEVDSWTATINENGNLRSAFTIDYSGWQSAIGKQDFSAHFAMLGGSRLVKVDLDLTQSVKTMAAGVVKHPDTQFIQGDIDITGKAYTYIASWGKQSLDGADLGMAIFFRKENLKQITEDNKNYIAVLSPQGAPTSANADAQQLSYYFAAVWQPESGIATKEKFVAYLEQEAEKLTVTPRVRLKTALSKAEQAKPVTAESALAWAEALAKSELERKTLSYRYDGWDVNRKRKPKFEYDIVGLNPMAYDELASATGNEQYRDVLKQVTATYIEDDGNIQSYKLSNYNIDSVAPGRAVLRLYQQTGEQKYKLAADLLRKQLAEQPRTSEGAFWHKKKYTGQLWLDGVYMGMPYLAEYSAMFEDGHSFDEVVREFELTRKYLRDAESGLYYHAWDELKKQDWADKQTGLSPEFWGRGMGWLAMALVDVLDYIPAENTAQRKVLLDMIAEVAVSLKNVQDESTGAWWQIMDKPNATANYFESSATAMFTYFYAKAINKGYLDSSYKDAALKAYQALISEFSLVHADGTVSMTNQCYVAGLGFGRNGSYHYYMSEPVWQNDIKGNFAYIVASIEVSNLLKK